MEFIYSMSGSRWCVLWSTLIEIWRLIGKFILKCFFCFAASERTFIFCFFIHFVRKCNGLSHGILSRIYSSSQFSELWSNQWKYHLINLWCVLYSVTTILNFRCWSSKLSDVMRRKTYVINATKIPFEIDQCRCICTTIKLMK